MKPKKKRNALSEQDKIFYGAIAGLMALSLFLFVGLMVASLHCHSLTNSGEMTALCEAIIETG